MTLSSQEQAVESTRLGLELQLESLRTMQDISDEVCEVIFEEIRRISGEFLDSDPPMFTDTLTRMYKLRDLCNADPEYGNDLKPKFCACK